MLRLMNDFVCFLYSGYRLYRIGFTQPSMLSSIFSYCTTKVVLFRQAMPLNSLSSFLQKAQKHVSIQVPFFPRLKRPRHANKSPEPAFCCSQARLPIPALDDIQSAYFFHREFDCERARTNPRLRPSNCDNSPAP